MEQFDVGTKIFMGEGCLMQLKKLEIHKAFIILDPYMKSSNMISKITDILDECNINYEMFSDILPDPSIQLVKETVKIMKEFNPDTIITFGGGSAIDTAKAVRFISYISENEKKEPLKFIAIPTTSGTGSEVTAFSVITDLEVGAKYPLVSDKMLPDFAILDPSFTLSIPPNITADTGVDVLTHALEAYVSINSNDFTDALAEKAIIITWKNLEKVVENGDNIKNRMSLQNASCLAGMAFNQTSLGICHSMAHALGANLHLSHGRSNALLLPHVIEYNLESENSFALSKYAEIAKRLGIYGSSDKTTTLLFIQKLKNLLKKVNIPLYINDTGIDLEKFTNSIPLMAETALADKCTLTNPRKVSKKDLENIYFKLLKGGN